MCKHEGKYKEYEHKYQEAYLAVVFLRPAFFICIAFHIISFGIFLSFGLECSVQHHYSNVLFSYILL